jgi:hypothetical protein
MMAKHLEARQKMGRDSEASCGRNDKDELCHVGTADREVWNNFKPQGLGLFTHLSKKLRQWLCRRGLNKTTLHQVPIVT